MTDVPFIRPLAVLAAAIALSACGKSSAPGHASSLNTSGRQTGGSDQASVQAMQEAVPGGHCQLDLIDDQHATPGGVTVISATQPLTAGGWLVDNANQVPATFTLLLVSPQKTYGFKAHTGVARPDVAKVLHAPSARTAGFNVSAPLGQAVPGTYQVMALIKKQGTNQRCDLRQRVKIKD